MQLFSSVLIVLIESYSTAGFHVLLFIFLFFCFFFYLNKCLYGKYTNGVLYHYIIMVKDKSNLAIFELVGVKSDCWFRVKAVELSFLVYC